jgi:HEAT repeat protein
MNRLRLGWLALISAAWIGDAGIARAAEDTMYDGKTASAWADIYRTNVTSRDQALTVLQTIPYVDLEPSCYKFFGLLTDKDPEKVKLGLEYIKLCKRGALRHFDYPLSKWAYHVPWRVMLANLYGSLGTEGLFDLSIPDRLLKDASPEVRKATISALLAVVPTDPKDVPADAPKDWQDQARKVLTLTFTDKETWEIRALALQTIGTLKFPVRDVLPELERCLKHKEWPVRNAAAKAIGDLGPPARAALPALTKIVEDTNEATPVAKSALAAIAAMGPKDALPFLIKTANGAGYFELRIESVRLLGTQGAPAQAALPTIGNYVRDPDWKMRVAAVQALGGLGTVAASQVATVTQALADPAWHVRAAALDAVVKLGDKTYGQSVNAVIQLLADKEWNVRGLAADTLSKMGTVAKTVAFNPLVAMARDMKEVPLNRDKAVMALKLLDPTAAFQAGFP